MSTVGKLSEALVLQQKALAIQAANNLLHVDGELDKEKYVSMLEEVGPKLSARDQRSQAEGSQSLMQNMHRSVLTKIFNENGANSVDEGIKSNPFNRLAMLVKRINGSKKE